MSWKVFDEGTIASDGTEQTIVEYTELGVLEGHLSFKNVIDGDSIVIRYYIKLKVSGDYELYDSDTYSGVQALPVIHFGRLIGKYGNMITLQQIVGEYRTFDYLFFMPSTKLDEIWQIQKGRWRLVNNQLIYYDEDGTTPLYTFNLYDKNGKPTLLEPYERRPA